MVGAGEAEGSLKGVVEMGVEMGAVEVEGVRDGFRERPNTSGGVCCYFGENRRL